MSSYDPKYEAYLKQVRDLHDALKRARRDHNETPTERYNRKEKEMKEKEKQKRKERQKELERERSVNKHHVRRLDKIHQDMVREREERERTNETADPPNEEDPLLKKPQMANMYDLLTQLHQCA
jgi:hypothetical protein